VGPFKYGDIVIVRDMLDPNGVNPKDRRAVVVTAPADLAAGHPVVVVAIAGLPPKGVPIPGDHVPLPWQAPHGHRRTKLTKPCAAVCTWLEEIADDRVLTIKGLVHEPYLSKIAAKLAEIRDRGKTTLESLPPDAGTDPAPHP
jgi:hypothetical protein